MKSAVNDTVSLKSIPTGVFVTLTKTKPSGAVQARKQVSGAVGLYWRYSIGVRSDRVLVGMYDSSAPPKSLSPTKAGYSVAAAVRAAEALAIEHYANREAGGRPAVEAQRRKAAEAEARAQQNAASLTLRSLLLAYCDHLEALGRECHSNVRSIFKVHIFEPWASLSDRPAASLSSDEFADVMRRVIGQGKRRTANKLRSYARAAFQTAKSARSKPSIPATFKEYLITANPIADTQADESANRSDKRPLTNSELHKYWAAIRKIKGIKGAALRIHLLSGGQRISQLVRLKTSEIQSGRFLLRDGKGRPGRAAREHWVPLVKECERAVVECAPTGEYALSTDGGKTHIANTTLSNWAREAAAIGGVEEFQAKRIRSGIETMLASVRVSKDIRGQLQSHGISGVQARHYDGHDYLAEKRSALELLVRQLNARHSEKRP